MKFIPELMEEVIKTIIEHRVKSMKEIAKRKGIDLEDIEFEEFKKSMIDSGYWELVKKDAMRLYPLTYKELQKSK